MRIIVRGFWGNCEKNSRKFSVILNILIKIFRKILSRLHVHYFGKILAIIIEEF